MSGIGDLFGGPPTEKYRDPVPDDRSSFDVGALFADSNVAGERAPAHPAAAASAPVTDQVPTFFRFIEQPVGEEPSSADGIDDAAVRRAASALDTVAIDEPLSAGEHVGELGPDPVVPVSAPAHRRGLRRGQWIGIAAAVVAVALIAGGVALGAVLNAKPSTVEALQQLDAAEQSLGSGIGRVNTDIDALTAAIASSTAVADSFADPLARMAGVSDETARTAAEQARLAYLSAIQAVAVPGKADVYERGDIDSEDLEAVDAARVSVEAEADEVERLAETVAATRRGLTDAETAFRAAIAAFAGTLPAFAGVVAGESPDAAEPFRAALAQSAQAASTTAVFGSDGFAAWDGYIAAVGALRADQQRGLAEREAREAAEAEEDDESGYYYVPPVVTPEPTPVDPGPVEPTPVEPTPVEPTPTDSGIGDGLPAP